MCRKTTGVRPEPTMHKIICSLNDFFIKITIQIVSIVIILGNPKDRLFYSCYRAVQLIDSSLYAPEFPVPWQKRDKLGKLNAQVSFFLGGRKQIKAPSEQDLHPQPDYSCSFQMRSTKCHTRNNTL